MTPTRRQFLVATAALAVSPALARPREPMETGTTERSGTLAGRAARWTEHVPHVVTGKVPLVLCLHYGGRVTPWYGRGVLEGLVLPAWKELGAVLVAPDCPSDGWWTDRVSDEVVSALLDDVAKRLPVDPKQVVVTGFSMGGIGSFHWSASDRVACSVPVAGRPPEGLVPKVPVYAIHSRADEVMAFEPTEARVHALKAAGADITWVPLEGVGHYATGRYVGPLRDALPWVRARLGA